MADETQTERDDARKKWDDVLVISYMNVTWFDEKADANPQIKEELIVVKFLFIWELHKSKSKM